MLMASIVLDNVSKTYTTPTGSLAALENISLRVERGELVALVGPSGCGKSTLLRLVADLDTASTGRIELFGSEPQIARLRRAYGIVFQDPALLEWRSAAQNIALPLELGGVPAAERAERVAALLKLVGLAEFAGSYPAQLSGGMQQRVAIARALALAPELLLMDEPFSALDELTRERLQDELLVTLAATPRATTVLFVTHSLPEAIYLADRVVIFSSRPGRILRVMRPGLPRPRSQSLRDDPRFYAALSECRAAMKGT